MTHQEESVPEVVRMADRFIFGILILAAAVFFMFKTTKKVQADERVAAALEKIAGKVAP